MCSTFYPGEIFLENASGYIYRVIALHTRRSVPVCFVSYRTLYYRGTPRARTRAKVVISCSTFSNADHCYVAHFLLRMQFYTKCNVPGCDCELPGYLTLVMGSTFQSTAKCTYMTMYRCTGVARIFVGGEGW